MIKNKSDYKRYLAEDAKALGKAGKKPRLIGDDIWKFERLMRKCEYSLTWKGIGKIYSKILRLRYLRLSAKMNYSIPLGVFGPGFVLVHRGPVVVSKYARVGANCRLQTMTCLGATNGQNKAPVIGDNVYIAVGAKVIGDITIANDVAIGAGAVVVKSITEEHSTWAGVPAKKISDHGSDIHIKHAKE